MAKSFDKTRSAIKNVYDFFSVYDPSELQSLYQDFDQSLMRARAWDYNDFSQLPNQMVRMIESVGLESISDCKEKEYIRNILWMWYHHAISCAVSRYGDKLSAQSYAIRALDLQPRGHPNKITRLLYYLVHDRLEDAVLWAKQITDEPEKTTALFNLELYRKHEFFKT